MVKEIDFKEKRGNQTRVCASQWDYGLRLNIRNIKAAEAHFAVNGSADNAAVVPLKEEGDVLTADVPDRFLRQYENVNVYLYEKAEEYGKTVAEIVIEIEPRQKPEDYIDTPEERKRFEVLEQEIQNVKDQIQSGVNLDNYYDKTQADETFQKRIERVVMSSTDTTAELLPDKRYVFPEMEELTINLSEKGTVTYSEYSFLFKSGENATVLTLPEQVKSDLAVEPNRIYECSIVDDLLAWMSWAV